MRISVTLIAFFLLLLSCSKEGGEESYIPIPETIPVKVTYDPTPLAFDIPSNFPELTYDINSNPPTEAGFALGKRLFYEGKLSSTGVISCGECHRQEFAFTHHTHIVSHGVDGALGTRNSPPTQNLAFMKEFNWDGAAALLDMQPIIPITAPVEMNETFASILKKLKNDPAYPDLFAKAFKNGAIDTENMLKALSQFMLLMISADSKYDKYIRDEGGVTLNEQEKAGHALFNAKCATCHSGELFTNQTYKNNGLPIDPEYNDMGRAAVSGKTEDNQKFKVPSLRNIELTLPYMHDGRFGTLEEVLDHYSSGVVDSPSLDPLLKQEDGTLGIPLTASEKTELLAFLKTLTDNDFALDKRFSEF